MARARDDAWPRVARHARSRPLPRCPPTHATLTFPSPLNPDCVSNEVACVGRGVLAAAAATAANSSSARMRWCALALGGPSRRRERGKRERDALSLSLSQRGSLPFGEAW